MFGRFLSAAAAVFALATGAAASLAADLATHRATYDMRLSPSKRGGGIVDVRGTMVMETLDACEGWEVRQRIRLRFTRADSDEFTTDSSFASFESKDGTAFQFSVRNAQNGEVDEELRGQASLEGVGGKGVALFTLPDQRRFDLPAGVLFPTAQLDVLIEAARAGDRVIGFKVFDGARLDGAFQANAVIARPPRSAAALPRGDVALLRNQPSWLVRMAFFSDPKETQPEYEIGMELLANGIARSMTLDYGDFAIDARLTLIEALPRPRC